MDPSQLIHELQPYLHRATWIMPAVAGYIAGRAAWGARKSSPFIRRCVAGLSLAILLAMPLYANQVMGVWATILVVGLAFAAVGLTRQAQVVATGRRGMAMRFAFRGLASLGAVAAMGAMLGVSSGGALVLSLGPSMWPTAPIAPTVEWLDVRAYRTAPPLPGEDIEFTVPWDAGVAFRETGDGWPTGRFRKRILATQGDTVEFRGHRVLVSGRVVMDCDKFRPTTWERAGRTWTTPRGAWWCYPDFAGTGPDYDRPLVWGQINELVHSGKQYTLGPGELFVMGDNTLQSSDSREFGAIQAQWVDGRHNPAPLPRGKTFNDY